MVAGPRAYSISVRRSAVLFPGVLMLSHAVLEGYHGVLSMVWGNY
jgi:hypothetical protein